MKSVYRACALLLLAMRLAYPDEGGRWHREAVVFPAFGQEAILLTGELLWLEREDLAPHRPGVVICHPDPRYGGTMANRVVRRLADTLAGAGMVTLRFNFRGVEGSGGSFGGGIEEVRDCLGALERLTACPVVDRDRVGLVGYSFGSAVALRASAQATIVKACACVAFPLPPSTADLAPYGYVREVTRPLLFVGGTEDHISDLETIRRLLKLVGVKATLQALVGADHFYGEEAPLAAVAQAVCAFMRDNLRPGQAREP